MAPAQERSSPYSSWLPGSCISLAFASKRSPIHSGARSCSAGPALPFTLLWIVGVINAMNLIDGLDGLAGGVALVAVATMFLVSMQRNQPLMVLFSASLGGAVLGFLFYNFNPASIFMGDTGSMFLGFVLATSSIRTNQKASTTVAVLIPIITLGLPILDTLLAMSRRAVRGRPLFRADKEHIHHRLLGLGLTHRQTVLALYGMCLVLGGLAVVLTYTNSALITATLLSALAMVAVLLPTPPRVHPVRDESSAVRPAPEKSRAPGGGAALLQTG